MTWYSTDGTSFNQFDAHWLGDVLKICRHPRRPRLFYRTCFQWFWSFNPHLLSPKVSDLDPAYFAQVNRKKLVMKLGKDLEIELKKKKKREIDRFKKEKLRQRWNWRSLKKVYFLTKSKLLVLLTLQPLFSLLPLPYYFSPLYFSSSAFLSSLLLRVSPGRKGGGGKALLSDTCPVARLTGNPGQKWGWILCKLVINLQEQRNMAAM